MKSIKYEINTIEYRVYNEIYISMELSFRVSNHVYVWYEPVSHIIQMDIRNEIKETRNR